MAVFEVPDVDLSRYSNRELAAIPLAVLAVALAVIVAWFLLYGTPVSLGIQFTGGTELVVQTDEPRSAVVAAFDRPVNTIRSTCPPTVADCDEYILTFQSTQGNFQQQAEAAGFEVPSNLVISPTFASGTQSAALFGVGLAFVGMSAVVFLLFRTFVPSVAVVVSAFSDIVVPVALMNLLGIKLSLGTVAALLMLIGYSVDSDILLNNHILRRSGGFYESAYRAMRTGVTMTLTSISAMIVMATLAWIFDIQLLNAIGVVLVMGLATDLMNTYMLNMSLLRWYKYEGAGR